MNVSAQSGEELREGAAGRSCGKELREEQLEKRIDRLS